ncbi:hypothetical protein [Bosea sp. 685]|uniref:hypothetical protein n=1 Tax=Bosea sp. 685 TaxID=3080057 RepID=UPI00289312A7|nr:hypothetical protein [Bosea sp. 685]WNJ91119.1 hypothetical protein RMR04_02085 [Bosea sp. 685]
MTLRTLPLFQRAASAARAFSSEMGAAFSHEQCSKLSESITFFAFGRKRSNAARSRAG